MATDSAELDAFYQFASQKFRQEGSAASLEDTLRAFRESERWQPRTALGQRLKELRQRFIAEGGELLTADEVAEEVRTRRGKHFAEE